FSASNITGNGPVDLVSYLVTNAAGETNPPPSTKEDVLIHVQLKVRQKIGQPAYGISIVNESGVLMTSINTLEQRVIARPLQVGQTKIFIRLKDVVFLPGIYTASFWVMDTQGHIYARVKNAIVLEISQSPLYGPCHIDHRWGCVYTDVQFSIDQTS